MKNVFFPRLSEDEMELGGKVALFLIVILLEGIFPEQNKQYTEWHVDVQILSQNGIMTHW